MKIAHQVVMVPVYPPVPYTLETLYYLTEPLTVALQLILLEMTVGVLICMLQVPFHIKLNFTFNKLLKIMIQGMVTPIRQV